MSSRVRRVAVGGWAPPGELRRYLFGAAEYQVWLDAGVAPSTSDASGRSYLGMGRGRVASASVTHGIVTERIVSLGHQRNVDTTIFEYLRENLHSPQIPPAEPPAHQEDSDSPPDYGVGFRLGWVGWLGYEWGAQTMGAPSARATDVQEDIPDACFMYIDRAIECDHAAQRVFALSLDGDDDWVHEVTHAVAATSRQSSLPRETSRVLSASLRHDHTAYESLIESCLAEIRAGNAYQLCLTNRIDLEFASPPDPFDVYDRLRSANPSHHGGLIVAGGVSLLSASPEVFLSVTPDGHATTKPIKGTRPRSADADVDAALADELRTNEKERAENLMIVDLMRNDLGRVCEVGSVVVEKLFDVESYASVHQLVSTVGGNLAAGVTAVDALAACFPAGSMTGAPKLSAMRILHELEAGPRGIYSGAFGYLSLDGSCDFAMVIRSIVLHGSQGYIGTGGGITSGSVPRDEWEETLVKARPLLTALGADLAGSPVDVPSAN